MNDFTILEQKVDQYVSARFSELRSDLTANNITNAVALALEIDDQVNSARKRYSLYGIDSLSYRGADTFKYQFTCAWLITHEQVVQFYNGLNGRQKANTGKNAQDVKAHGEHTKPTSVTRRHMMHWEFPEENLSLHAAEQVARNNIITMMTAEQNDKINVTKVTLENVVVVRGKTKSVKKEISLKAHMPDENSRFSRYDSSVGGSDIGQLYIFNKESIDYVCKELGKSWHQIRPETFDNIFRVLRQRFPNIDDMIAFCFSWPNHA